MINKNEEVIDASCFMLYEKVKEKRKGIKLSDNDRRQRLTNALCLPIGTCNQLVRDNNKRDV
jgi:hypothetical protein